ncbi:MAG: Na+/H+ antiporter subunit E, partial [Campylobacterota bacterium]
GVFLFDIIIANLTVAKQILSPNDQLNPQTFKLPLDIEHPLGISFLASTISLTPGTVSCDLSEDRSYLVIHALSLEDEAKEIETIKNRYEKPLMEVFKRC